MQIKSKYWIAAHFHPDILDDPSLDGTMTTEKSGKCHAIFFTHHKNNKPFLSSKIDGSIQISTTNNDDETTKGIEFTSDFMYCMYEHIMYLNKLFIIN